jgi:hypothetical protein
MQLHPNKRFKKDEPVELVFPANLIELEVKTILLFYLELFN